MIYYSLLFKRLLYKHPIRKDRQSHRSSLRSLRRQVTVFIELKNRESTRHTSSHVEIFVWRSLRIGWVVITFVWDSLSIRGRHFDFGFLLRESIEICVQTYQAYQLSFMAPLIWVNNLSIAVLVLNCWTTPLVDGVFHTNEALRRVMCLTVDVFLDFFSLVIIPFAVFFTYRSMVPQTDWYDPMWILSSGDSLLFFHFSGWWNLLSRLMPALSIIMCLNAIEPLLRNRGAEREAASQRAMEATHTQIIAPVSRFSKIFHGLLIVYGATALVVFLLADTNARQEAIQGCKVIKRPWFVSKYPCAVLEINCDEFGIAGRTEELESILNHLDPHTLSMLVFSHCPSLEVPDVLQTFSMMIWLEFYNSTIEEWPTTAAITVQHNVRLSRVFFILTNMSSLPLGLQSFAFLSTVYDLEFVGTNLSSNSLPRDLATTWRHTIRTLVFERGSWEEVPIELTQLRAMTLSLAGQGITNVSIELLSVPNVLRLAMNPLTDLPSSATTRVLPQELHLEATLLAHIPSWIERMVTTRATKLYAEGSPLCANTSVEATLVNCRTPLATAVDSYYQFPLAAHIARRRGH
ncbi:TPA: hypothetical protein N0F65_010643 [Lagenidium giganteum]|uniref:Uncharacterized protein n=1 Tax=Lagenidium giganteum TaxID=4803 RepID=A0AAV2ZDC9_9STRA|nr:TPA: hypothetical protein N0F65_010643 [Lagenidium giganteum]